VGLGVGSGVAWAGAGKEVNTKMTAATKVMPAISMKAGNSFLIRIANTYL